MTLEETLLQTPHELMSLLIEVVVKEFGTKPFTIGEENTEYEELVRRGLLTVVERTPRRTTYQQPPEVYNAVKAYSKPREAPSQPQTQGLQQKPFKIETAKELPNLQPRPPSKLIPPSPVPNTNYSGTPLPAGYLIKLLPHSIKGKLSRLLKKGLSRQIVWEENDLESKVRGLSHTYVLSIGESSESPPPPSEPATYNFELRAVLFSGIDGYLLWFDNLEKWPKFFAFAAALDLRYLSVKMGTLARYGAAYFVDRLATELWQEWSLREFAPEFHIEKESLSEELGQFIEPIGNRRFLYVEISGGIKYLPMRHPRSAAQPKTS